MSLPPFRDILPRNTSILFSSFFIVYLTLVWLLRYQRRDSTARRFASRSLGSMTLEEAHSIQLQLAEQEFPKIFSTSIFFALFKTYGIPSISRLLVATGQLATPETASKRASDTGVLLTEVILNHPSSKRTVDGISRMNYLHGLYRQSGKISNDDMLYTMSLFALEPLRWVDRFEWRLITNVERCATGVYWRNMADCMEIELNRLPSSNSGWSDGLKFLRELEAWSIEYEDKHMVPAESNHILAEGTLDIAIFNMPRILKNPARQFTLTLLDNRLRRAMSFNEPPSLYAVFLMILASTRKLILRHLALPRPRFLKLKRFSETPDHEGYIHSKRYMIHPWYVKPTYFNRWGPSAIFGRLLGLVIPGDDGEKYHPRGYKLEDIGPEAHRGKGQKQMNQSRLRLREISRAGCPFAAW